ncbi:hypothetical protein BN1708_005529 [Verticillium longisporum]|uniref:NACHT domain-containing protein n=2 Tax=Verticillium longisporum TaxID=100787 RepID=A0A0G4MBP6_VERLO|nr:hypothetical protein BN1708_005529 [Verticillium longisporum]
MDPASLISLIGSIVGIVDATSTATHKLLKSAKLPDAFKQVEKHLPLVKQTLEDARRTIDNSVTEDQRIVVRGVLHDCNSKARELDRIFKGLEKNCDNSEGEKSWETIRGWYREILQGAKGHKVEALMNDIMGSLTTLGTLNAFKTPTYQDVEDIKRALDELSKVEPSLDDADFGAAGSNYAHQTVATGAVGQQNNPTGGTNTFESSMFKQGNSGTMNFGADQFWHDLYVTDPRDDKVRIESTKGDLIVDCYSWIFSQAEFLQWRDSPQSRLLWIKGDPGKGKTMLLCGIINELSETSRETEKPAYFFCQDTDERLNSGTAVLRGLIYLLIEQCPQLIPYVRTRYDKVGKSLFTDVNAWFALSRILTDMLADTLLKGKTIVIDALDECATEQKQLLDLILKLSSSSDAKWLFSSRNSPPVEQTLAKATQGMTLCLELQEAFITGAVRVYIQRQVDDLDLEERFSREMRDTVQEYLVTNANDTFLWVALVCHELIQLGTGKQRMLDTLQSFPPGLDELYGRMVRIIKNYRSRDTKLCIHILATLSVAYRPIALDELAVLIEASEGYKDGVQTLQEDIRLCGSFLTLRDGVVYFVHQSAKDYLLSQDSGEILPLGIAHQHSVVFSTSLKILSRRLRRDIYDLAAPGILIDEIHPPDPDPLAPVRYGCKYWADHLCQSGPDRMQETEGCLHVFLKQTFLHWLEAMSLCREIPHAVQAIQKLETMDVSDLSQDLSEQLRDALRFVLYYRSMIESAPLQLYVAALVFTPMRSVVKSLYQDEAPSWVTFGATVEQDWSACLQTLEGHDGTIYSVSFTEDGHRLASASEDGTVKIWDVATGTCLQTLEGHNGCIMSAAFIADDRLASASQDGMIQLWDVATGKSSKHSSLHLHHGTRKKNIDMYEIYAAGAAAAFTVDCLIYPLDTLKTRYQSQDFVKTYASSPGSPKPQLYRGLYQGIGSVILATLPAAGIFFATYESMKRTISLAVPAAPQPLVHSSASAIAEMASCVVLAPAEVIKQNAQMLRHQSGGSRKSTSLEALRHVTGSGASRRLFSGYTALVARNLPFTALQFPIFEYVRQRTWDSRHPGQAHDSHGLLETAAVNGVSAGSAGGFAAWITTPSDVVKTRMMLTAGDDNNPSGKKTSRGSVTVAQDVYRSHGVKGLFRGGLLRASWTALGSGLYLGTYEMSKTTSNMATALSSLIHLAAPGLRNEASLALKQDSTISVAEVEAREQARWLVHSPYTERDHQLDLHTLDHENALLARAMTKMECTRTDYATAPYTESFNWRDVHDELRRLVKESGKPFKETSFYVVVFLSQIPPTTVYADLGALDKEAHREANEFGGFLKYWFGAPDAEGRNLATCFWRSRPDAVRAGHGPAHRKAARATASMYSFWKIDRHRLIVNDDAESFEFIDWED